MGSTISYDAAKNLCHYDEKCDNEILGRDTYQESGFIDFVNAKTSYCNVPITCRGQRVDIIDDEVEIISGGRYVNLARSLVGTYPFMDFDRIQDQIDRVMSSPNGPCALWYFCPQTLLIWSNAWYIDPACQLKDGSWDEDFIVEGNCVKLDCTCEGFPENFPFCLEDEIKRYGIPIPDLTVTKIDLCKPTTVNIAKLILNEDLIHKNFPEYESTQLYRFIHEEILPDYYNRRKAICSTVTFCVTDLSIISNNLDDNDCGGLSGIPIAGQAIQLIIDQNGQLVQLPSSTNTQYDRCVITPNNPHAICEYKTTKLYGSNVPYNSEDSCPEFFVISPGVSTTLSIQSPIDINFARLEFWTNGHLFKTYEEKFAIKKGWNHFENLYLNLGASQRFEARLVFDNQCPTLRAPYENFKGPDDEEYNCNNRIYNITYDRDFDQYNIFYENKNKNIGSFELKKYLNAIDMSSSPEIVFDNDIIQIRVDSSKNHYILSSTSQDITQFNKIDKDGNIKWTYYENDFLIKNVSEDLVNGYNIIGYNEQSNNWVNKIISKDGELLKQKDLSLSNILVDIIYYSENTAIAFEKNNHNLIFSSNANLIQKPIPQLISVKDIKTLENGNILIAGDYEGEMTLGGKAYNSNGYKNAIFLTYDVAGTLLSSQSIQRYRDETIQGIATKGNSEVAYFGKYEEVVNYFEDPALNEIDSCNFIEIIRLDDQCTPFPSILTYDKSTCQLTWDSAPSGYATALQMEVNGVWLPAEKALGIDVTPVSPYTITKDGKYRLLSKKEGCPDIISNIVQTSCTASCTCDVPVLSYSANNCQLTWTNNCSTYTVSLQRLNNANIWETVVQQAVSPYNVQTNGQYRLYLSTSATSIGLVCPPVSSNTVTTACTPSTNACSCSVPTLSHNSTACTLTWSVSGCTGYTTTLQRSIAGVWTSISASSPYTIPTGSNGQYRILTSKAGCTDVVSNIVNVSCSCASPASITIFDYGTSGLGQNATIPVGQSYTHEVSQGAPDACDDSYIQLAFSSSVVNSSWNFYVNGTIAVMPGIVIGSQYIVDLYLPTPPSGGTADVFIQSPCGDFYQLHLVYDCAPGSNPCNQINVTFSGDYNNSCSNLTINVSGGQSPYTYSVTGTGNLGTVINQSSANVDLSTLDASEAIILNVIVTDQNNCTGNTSFTYLRCATSCNGSTCSSQPAVCNGILSTSSGYNEDAIINFLVPNGVTELTVDLAPLAVPQSLDILINGIPALDSSVNNVYALDTTYSRTSCQNQGINILDYNIGEQIYGGGFRVYYDHKDFASHPLQVAPGDIITININHPNCTIPTIWTLKINCNGAGNRPLINEFELPAEIDLEVTDPFVKNSSYQVESFRFFPNPFSKGINFEMNSDIAESVALQAYNTVGTLMFERKIELLKGVNLRYIDAFENVPSGVYIVKIKSPTKDYTTKVIRVD